MFVIYIYINCDSLTHTSLLHFHENTQQLQLKSNKAEDCFQSWKSLESFCAIIQEFLASSYLKKVRFHSMCSEIPGDHHSSVNVQVSGERPGVRWTFRCQVNVCVRLSVSTDRERGVKRHKTHLLLFFCGVQSSSISFNIHESIR